MSTLKVDTIQKTNGSAPTLSDLSISHAGSILQTRFTQTSTEVSVAGTTWTDSGLSLAITPKATSSTILVVAGCCFDIETADNASIRILRDSTNVHEQAYMAYSSATGWHIQRDFVQYEDAPSTTSAITYKVQFQRTTGDSTLYMQYDSGSNESISSLTLMEIVG